MTNEQIEREITNIAKVSFNNCDGELLADELTELKRYILDIVFEGATLYISTTEKHLSKFLIMGVSPDEVGYIVKGEGFEMVDSRGYMDGHGRKMFLDLVRTSGNPCVIRFWWD